MRNGASNRNREEIKPLPKTDKKSISPVMHIKFYVIFIPRDGYVPWGLVDCLTPCTEQNILPHHTPPESTLQRMPLIPEDILQRIRDATDIADVVGEHVQLSKKGRNLFGLCPFHNENSPSFSVSPERQIYHCFGCGAGGNVFKFIQEIDRVSFVEAVTFLAQRASISLPQHDAQSRAHSEASDEIYRANELANKYYHHMPLND